ncbi:MAG: integration host factor subunit beta [Deltaproteobacteria bacterium]|jgi:integration host factor subunit beta|nr:integration host factor subunit beta [Deltaproteobacteria bacterium]
MNKTQLIEAMYRRMSSSSKTFKTYRTNQMVVDRFFEIIHDGILADQRIVIRGFGVFVVKNYRSYMGRDPRTGEQVLVDSKRLPFFKPGKHLKKTVDIME